MIVNTYVIIPLLRGPFTAKELLSKLDSRIVNHHGCLGSCFSGHQLVAFCSGPTCASLESGALRDIRSLCSDQIIPNDMLLYLTTMHPPYSWRSEALRIVLHVIIHFA